MRGSATLGPGLAQGLCRLSMKKVRIVVRDSRPVRKLAVSVLLALIGVVLVSAQAGASSNPSDLDPSWSGDGVAHGTDVLTPGSQFELGSSFVVPGSSNVVVAGL